jgi:hypothetical protein
MFFWRTCVVPVECVVTLRTCHMFSTFSLTHYILVLSSSCCHVSHVLLCLCVINVCYVSQVTGQLFFYLLYSVLTWHTFYMFLYTHTPYHIWFVWHFTFFFIHTPQQKSNDTRFFCLHWTVVYMCHVYTRIRTIFPFIYNRFEHTTRVFICPLCRHLISVCCEKTQHVFFASFWNISLTQKITQITVHTS